MRIIFRKIIGLSSTQSFSKYIFLGTKHIRKESAYGLKLNNGVDLLLSRTSNIYVFWNSSLLHFEESMTS